MGIFDGLPVPPEKDVSLHLDAHFHAVLGCYMGYGSSFLSYVIITAHQFYFLYFAMFEKIFNVNTIS